MKRIVTNRGKSQVVKAKVSSILYSGDGGIVHWIGFEERLESIKDAPSLGMGESRVNDLVLARLLDDNIAGVKFQKIVARREVVDEWCDKCPTARVRLRGGGERQKRVVRQGFKQIFRHALHREPSHSGELHPLGLS